MFRGHDKEYYLSFIGKKYLHKLKNRKDIYTVTDCFFVYNSKGECVKVYYSAETEFLGAPLVDHEVVLTTIQMRGIDSQ
jgi:hypothetical protein